MFKLLFVCSGNICRSPTAQGVFNHLLAEAGLNEVVISESAGTHGLHLGEGPDPRAVAAAKKRGYSMEGIKARMVDPLQLSSYQLVVCMDHTHYQYLMERCHPNDETKIKLLLHYHPGTSQEDVPDPYYGGPKDFEEVLDLIEESCRKLLESLKNQVPSLA